MFLNFIPVFYFERLLSCFRDEMCEKIDKSFALDVEMEEYLADVSFFIGIYEPK